MCDLNQYCRLCLTQQGVEMRLFDESVRDCGIPLYEKVKMCVSVQIETDDGLPTLLCKTCADLVEKIWNFKTLSMHVDTSLRKILENTNDKFDWAEKIASLAKETHQISSRATQGRRMIKLEEPLLPAFISQSGSDDDWSGSALSRESPIPPQSPASDQEDEDFLPPKNKRKQREHACEFCGRKFTRSDHLAQHKLTHTSEKPFQCSDCGKSFSYKGSLIGHIKQTHTGDCNYTCELCGKGFFKKTELDRHKATHSNLAPHKCPQCGMGFKITKSLKRHIRNVHEAQRSHVCHTCGKSFIQLQTLKVHMVLHSGEKPYKCSYCGKGFAQSAPLKIHLRIHTGEKPYSCHVCQETFKSRAALRVHAFSHRGVLPYPCLRCERSFRLKKDLVCHEQGHDDVEDRLKQFPLIKEETPDGMDQLPNELDLSQDSQEIGPLEAAISDNTELFDTFQLQ